ncbi:NADH dehydrogenase [ubiquinone] 1 alpha subcomplex subunit 7 isoform X1 [Amblyraja radiata]|uniref:NADH dehydrogenase [ubiquinone] 1 alpha subcomplex subunit 7 isoform X1 n=1 Tax=Amblyraja radiata TaxID=386614 RepID=UPI0014028B75|nr:NADH dehydrogenase [ubiquinone] 1 alpha subcomplex subunit 7 isoform X1 [Amblyraja radiata]
MASATKIIQWVRNLAAGRNLQAKLQLRYTEVASRSPEPPILPVGPSHKFADNYYCLRDGRRETSPPTIIWSPQIALGAETTATSSESTVAATGVKMPVTPGQPVKMELSTDQPYL